MSPKRWQFPEIKLVFTISESLALLSQLIHLHNFLQPLIPYLLRFDTVGPMYQAMPDFLAKIHYQDITDNTNTVHQAAWKTDKPAFMWFAEHPKNASYFNDYMLHRRKGMPTWLDVYPVEEETKGWSSDAPVFIDIGGNIGHQCAELRSKYPQLPGQIILQDLPQPISQALSTPGVVNMVHDAFQPEPVKGTLRSQSCM